MRPSGSEASELSEAEELRLATSRDCSRFREANSGPDISKKQQLVISIQNTSRYFHTESRDMQSLIKAGLVALSGTGGAVCNVSY